MTSTHHHHAKYSLPPPPQNSQNDYLRLPSLKDLNFQYASPQNGTRAQPQQNVTSEPQPQQQEHSSVPRHVSAWGRSQNSSSSNPSTNSHPHQQHTPPLSAGAHEISAPKVEYPSKHDNGGYVHPGVPLSAQVTPVPGSVNIGTLRNEEAPHSPNQPKRPRTTSTNMGTSRDVRASHQTSYPPPQYASYPPASQQPPASNPYHQIPSGMPGPPTHQAQQAPPPPTHEQMHQQTVPVANHPNYATYSQYMQTRAPPPPPPIMHQQHHQSNPYPSPGPPPSAPPPQGPWAQQAHPPPPPPTQHAHHHQQQQPPQPPLQQPHHVHPSQLHHQPPPQQQQAPMPSNAPPQPAYMVPQHHMQQQPLPQQAPPPHHQPQHAPQPPQHQPQYQQPTQQMPFAMARTTPIVPTNVDARPPYAPAEPERIPVARNDTMAEINQHCSILYHFASRYAQMPHAQPSPNELEEMSQRAQTVVRLLEDLNRMYLPEAEQNRDTGLPTTVGVPMQVSPEDPRPPKRPWEDISQDDNAAPVSANTSFEQQQHQQQQQQQPQYSTTESNKPQSTLAEQDMELIRNKRATSTAGTNGPAGQPKSKYRKRSRATPPGKCHSCNIRETPEWRRGPDGARTLCNACGLHYAKLMRKRDKSANGDAPQIDLETLRASARAADIADKATRSTKPSSSRSHQQSEPASPMDTKAQILQHHQSSFQLMAPPPPQEQQSSAMAVDNTTHNSNNNGSSSSGSRSAAQPPPPQHAHQNSMSLPGGVPPPPWATPSSSTSRVYSHAPTDHLQPQSFMRSSQHAPSR